MRSGGSNAEVQKATKDHPTAVRTFLSGSAPTKHHSPQLGVLARSPGERCVATRQEDEVGEIRALHALGKAVFHPNEAAAKELHTAFVA
jgi:hypothetical protein